MENIKHILNKTRPVPSKELISDKRQKELLAEDQAMQKLITETINIKESTNGNTEA